MTSYVQGSNVSRVIRIATVAHRVGLCRAEIYKRMKAGNFPKSISLGARAVGWFESDIDFYLETLRNGGGK